MKIPEKSESRAPRNRTYERQRPSFTVPTMTHSLLSPTATTGLVVCILSPVSASRVPPTPASPNPHSHLLFPLPDLFLQLLWYHFTSEGYRVETFGYAPNLTGKGCAFRRQQALPLHPHRFCPRHPVPPRATPSAPVTYLPSVSTKYTFWVPIPRKEAAFFME